jgi:branched-chain amino acid transport system substrate-binding protein
MLGTRVAMLSAFGVATLVISGCSSTGGANGTSTNSVSASSSAAALSGAPVTLGVITDASGSTGENPSMAGTASRWVDYTNSHGGIGGHPVKVIVKDTQNNAATALQVAQELVEQDKVVAIGDDSYVNTAFAKYLDGKQIPVISMGAGFTSFTYVSDANFFSPTVNVLTDLWGLTKAAALLGKHSFAYMYCAEIAACASAVPIVKGFVESNSGKMAYSAGFSASSPSYAAQCLAAKGAGVDALLAGGSVAAANQRFYDDCAKQGYQPLAVLAVSAVNPDTLSDPSIPLATSVIGVLPWFEKQGPTSEAFHATMDKYLQAKSSKPFLVANHWAGLEMFKASIGTPTATAPTTADVYKGLYSMQNETLGGFVPPFSITEGKPGSAQCLYAYQSSKGTLSTLNGGKTVCMTS